MLPHLETHLKQLYHEYRHTADIDAKGRFFSRACRQINRADFAWARTTREGIVQDLKRFAAAEPKDPQRKPKAYYTIRPLTREERRDFGTDAMVEGVGMTVPGMRELAEREVRAGMRVDLWGEDEGARLVKVQYWWRQEGGEGEWLQCFHDIMYLGPRDGSEGREGEVRE